MAAVIEVLRLTEELALGELDHRREDVLVQLERVLPERQGADGNGTVAYLDERQP